MASQSNSLRAILFALGANFCIFVFKLGAAWLTKSGAMLAEAIHSLADCGNQGLLLIGLSRSKRAASDEHPLGYGKTIYFWSFVVALVLFSMGGLFSLMEGWHKLHEPEALSWPWVAVGVLSASIIAESISMRACIVEVNKVRGDRSFWRWFRESRQAELVVIFGEDLAALLGLVLALIAVVLTMITGDPMWDALGTLAIGTLLIAVAFFIAIEIKSLLIGQGVDPVQRQQLLEFLGLHEYVEEVYDLRTLQMGNDVMLAVKAKMAPVETPELLIERINQVEKAIKTRFPQVRWSFFEPDNSAD